MPAKFTSYDDVMGYIRRFTDYERMVKTKPMPPYGVTRMERLLEWLGNPEREFPAIHIAGTKGKGSTAAMLASILKAAGLRAGLYTSPHLLHERERIAVDGHWISEEEIVAAASRMAPYLDLALKDGDTYAPTFFEIFTTAAFLHFVAEHVDYAVLETGLGGRLDATNVCQPVVCGITQIGYDHMDKLGDTLDRIAWEKAGIIKKGVPVVCAPQDPKAMNAIFAATEGRGCRLVRVGEDVTWQCESSDADGCRFKVTTWRGSYPELRLPLAGEHQVANAAVAISLAEVLCEKGAAITEDHIREGLASLDWRGRIDVAGKRPWLIVDGAHNVPAAAALRQTLATAFPCRRRIFVLGIAQDKEVDDVLRELAPLADEMIFTKADNPRATSPTELAGKMAAIRDVPISTEEEPRRALALAREKATPDDLICVTGSFYLAGEIQLLLDKCGRTEKAAAT